MKLFIITALFFIGTFALAQTQDSSSQDFLLNQETQSLSLESKTFETVYRTDYVNDTCYRSETQGSRTECHTEYDRQCHTEYRQQCSYQTYPVCQSFPQNVCHPSQVCHTVMDSVCNSHGCTSVPRNVCQTTNQCSTQMQQVCHSEQRYQCDSFPQTLCQDVPRQACQTVPNVVQVPYACQKPVQVAVGQNLKLHTQAQVTVKFENFSTLGSLSDRITAKLVGDQIRLTTQSSTALFQIIHQDRSETQVSATEKALTLTLTLRATLISKLNEFSALHLSDGQISSDRIEFSMSAFPDVPFSGHLELTRHRLLARDETVIDRSFESRLLVGHANREALMLRALGVDGLRSKRHTAKLRLSLDGAALRNGAINPEALNSVNSTPLELQFEGKPE